MRRVPWESALLFRSRKKKAAERVNLESNLGFRSGFVLAKLGHDLREQYQEVLTAPLPAEMEKHLDRLKGPGATVERLDDFKRG